MPYIWCSYTDVSLTMLVPFSGGHYIDLGWLAIPLMYFAVIGTVNGVNLQTDWMVWHLR